MQHLCFRFSIAACALTAWVMPGAAHATYSIAAVDMSTQEVGGAITSCVGSLDVGIVYGALPGVGVIHAQAQLDQRGRAKTRALELLMQGMAPNEIIEAITEPGFDPGYAARQYGVVDLIGRAAGYTGAQAQAYKRDQQGTSGPFAFSVQGNILTSQAVLDQATQAFEAPACDLAERLMRALEAGADNGEGDSRCTGDGIPSDSAYIQVDRPGQSEPYLRLSVADTGPESPLPQLRKQFDAWRAQHPCVMPSSTQGSAGTSAAGGGGSSGTLSGTAGVSAAAGSGGSASAASASSGSAATAPASGTPATAGSAATASGASATAGSAAAASGAQASAGSAANSTRSAAGVSGNGAARATTGGRAASTAMANAGTTSSPSTAAAASVSNAAIAQPEPSTSSGCSLLPSAQHSRNLWLLAPAMLWCVRRARRRRATLAQSPFHRAAAGSRHDAFACASLHT